jgi:signal peptidase I
VPDESAPEPEPQAEKDPKKRNRSLLRELPILVGVALVLSLLIKTFLIQAFFIPSESMERTLHGCAGCTGDRILVEKVGYRMHDPRPGDIVVFRAPPSWEPEARFAPSKNPVRRALGWVGAAFGLPQPNEKDLVKRVIAVGGQSVRCCDDNGNVQVSDHGPAGPWRSLNEPYIYQNSSWTKPSTPGVRGPDDSRTFGPVTIPADRLWVMGDHRNDSADSRYHCGDQGPGPNCDPVDSTVGVSDVIGKAVVIAWPPSRWRTLGTPRTFTSLGLPGLGALPSEPAAFAVVVVGLLGGWRRSRRR